ncbi:hypothetical protein AB0G32_00510 [Streptomyces sp. NPDC023723]|uniref:hypothetical protein n=1 Tax=Streptomyces sp. NPDC023723 TaxID=3154323 RepID=UPI003407BD98
MPSRPAHRRDAPHAVGPVDAEPGGLVRSGADRRWAAGQEAWLLSAHACPRLARVEWQTYGVAVLPLGTVFSTVRIPGRLVQAVAASTDPLDVACLGLGAYLGVPRLDAVEFSLRGNGSYWSVAPESAGSLCRPLAVARLVAAGVHALDETGLS